MANSECYCYSCLRGCKRILVKSLSMLQTGKTKMVSKGSYKVKHSEPQVLIFRQPVSHSGQLDEDFLQTKQDLHI